jgi:hypothetical protein
MTVDQQFNIINDKLQLLLKQHIRLQKENERLREELQQAGEREHQAVTKMEELSQQVTILRVSSGDMNDSDRKEFEKKINQYIKEIDRCISYLSE